MTDGRTRSWGNPIHAGSASRNVGPAAVPPKAMPNVKDIVIQDDTPVDNIYVEKQQRLLTEPLYTSWRGPGRRKPFLALANVGLFFNPKDPPLVPGRHAGRGRGRQEGDPSQKENNTYFVWTRGKVPDLIIEIVSDRRGGEQTHKMRKYATWAFPYYVIFDPGEVLLDGVLRAFGLNRRKYEPAEPAFFEEVGLGLKLWQGAYEEWTTRWLRLVRRQGQPHPHRPQERTAPRKNTGAGELRSQRRSAQAGGAVAGARPRAFRMTSRRTEI